MSTLLSEIEAFTARHDMSEWAFGEAALNDRHFIRQLRDGRDIRISTHGRVTRFMAEYRPARSSEGVAAA
jgi:hypothetical protein